MVSKIFLLSSHFFFPFILRFPYARACVRSYMALVLSVQGGIILGSRTDMDEIVVNSAWSIHATRGEERKKETTVLSSVQQDMRSAPSLGPSHLVWGRCYSFYRTFYRAKKSRSWKVWCDGRDSRILAALTRQCIFSCCEDDGYFRLSTTVLEVILL